MTVWVMAPIVLVMLCALGELVVVRVCLRVLWFLVADIDDELLELVLVTYVVLCVGRVLTTDLVDLELVLLLLDSGLDVGLRDVMSDGLAALLVVAALLSCCLLRTTSTTMSTTKMTALGKIKQQASLRLLVRRCCSSCSPC